MRGLLRLVCVLLAFAVFGPGGVLAGEPDSAGDRIPTAKGTLTVYPYHYRNGDKTLADLEEFKRLVGPAAGVEVRLRDWYRQ